MTANEIKNTAFYKKVEDYVTYRGYELVKCFYSERLEAFQVSVSPISEFAPDISMIDGWVDDARDLEFEMQTVAFGSLRGKELEEYKDCVVDGCDLVRALNNIDWSRCPILDASERWK